MHEYRTVIINVGGSSKKISDAIDLVDKHMLDGLIINADVDKSDIERLRLIPAVSFECEMGEGIPLVASDHIKGGELAAKLLFRCGCKNVAILSIAYFKYKGNCTCICKASYYRMSEIIEKKRCKSNDCRA